MKSSRRESVTFPHCAYDTFPRPLSSVLLLSIGFETGTIHISYLICNKPALLRAPLETRVGCLCNATATRMPTVAGACAICVLFVLRIAQAQQASTAIPGRQVSYHNPLLISYNAVCTIWGYVTVNVARCLQAVAADAGRARMRWS